jgi:hypothetical protein
LSSERDKSITRVLPKKYPKASENAGSRRE